jgi:mannan endo-1,4-beta-mannosidase
MASSSDTAAAPRHGGRRLRTVLLAAIWQLLPAQAQQGGFSISGTSLIDANGNEFVMRGSSHPHVWYQGEFESFRELSELGANTVRVVLGSGHRNWGTNSPEDVANVVAECKAQRIICVLEVHDTTGYGEEGAAASLDQAVTYWQGLYDVLQGEEAYVLINIGNEPWGNQNTSGWTQATIDAIQRMRSIGFEHTLVVDAPNWGQDWSNTMRDNAPAVAAADSHGNTLFSVHMYQVYGTPQSVTAYFNAFEQMNLPLIVGEYGDHHQGEPVAWQTVQSEAQARGIGWIAWSYSGNSGGAEHLDQVVNFNPNQLTQWGERVFTSQYGIQNTAERASVFNGNGGPTSPTSPTPSESETPSETPSTPMPGGCSATITVVNDWGSGWQGNVTVTAGQQSVNGWSLQWTWPGNQGVSSHWNANLSTSGGTVTASDVGWNGQVPSGQSREVFGFIGSGSSTAPTVSCTAG